MPEVWNDNYLYRKFRTLILYGLIGCFSSSLDFCVYTLLVKCTALNYLVANCISVVCGIVTSFTLNRSYNFKVKDKAVRRFVVFLTVGLCGLAMSNAILYVAIQMFDLNKLLSKLLSIVIVVLLQFVANRYITFKSNEDKR